MGMGTACLLLRRLRAAVPGGGPALDGMLRAVPRPAALLAWTALPHTTAQWQVCCHLLS